MFLSTSHETYQRQNTMPNVTYNDYKGKHQHATEVNGSSVDGSDVADGGEANNPLASQI